MFVKPIVSILFDILIFLFTIESPSNNVDPTIEPINLLCLMIVSIHIFN